MKKAFYTTTRHKRHGSGNHWEHLRKFQPLGHG